MKWQVLGTDANGATEYFALSEKGEMIVKTVWPTEYANWQLEKNKQEQTDNPKNQTKDKTLRKVASIPLLVIEIWKKLYGVDPLRPENKALLQRLLNDPDFRECRTDTGRVELCRRS